MAATGAVALWIPCCRCGQSALGWDRIADKAYCPNCQEAIVQGIADPLIEKTERLPCAACKGIGCVTVQTFPRGASEPVEMELCPEHLRGLLGRKLAAHTHSQLRKQLQRLSVDAADVFLLHEAFYDAKGRARQPAAEAG